MSGVIRRRNYTSKKIEVVDIDRPDYWRIDFTTTSDNQTVVFGSNSGWALSNPETKAIILDGKSISRTSGSSIKVPTAGDHVVYIKVSQPYGNGSYNFGITSSSLKPSYVRLPTGWKSKIRTDAEHTIPVLDLLTTNVGIYRASGNSITIDLLRVSEDVDISNVNANFLSIANKVIKVKYNIIT